MSTPEILKNIVPERAMNTLNLMARDRFVASVEEFLHKNPDTDGAIVYLDVQRFTLINAIFGMAEGDRLLMYIAERVKAVAAPHGFASRFGADRFAFFLEGGKSAAGAKIRKMLSEITDFDLPYDIMCSAGVYLVHGASVPVSTAIDGAVMAEKDVKGNFFHRVNFFSDDIRKRLINDQLIVGTMDDGLKNGEFEVYYQPIYNHSTHTLVGAEALTRWNHPTEGLLTPDRFISIFERTGFVVALDRFVLRSVCAFLRRQLDEGMKPVPISVNLARNDIVMPDVAEVIDGIRKEYDVPVKYLRLEITESSAIGQNTDIARVLASLHSYGYTVEMDDFGSGYSSLNLLKDLDFDIIKLDTRFLSSNAENIERCKVIVSSVVRMTHWLHLPVIAEGVETVRQADFLRSYGCDVVQGYLYSRPVPEAEFTEMLKKPYATPESLPESLNSIKSLFGDMENFIFSDFAGAAMLFDYSRQSEYAEVLRVNGKFLRELGMNLTEQEFVDSNLIVLMDDSSREAFKSTLEKSIETRSEQECEVWMSLNSQCCGEEHLFVRFNIHYVGTDCSHEVFYAVIRNITEERRLDDILSSERRFKAAGEQVNIYYWEYDIATHKMYPCFRCMRDLGFPAVVNNYPESAIEMGVFPPEVADEYRRWMRSIDAGEVESLDGIFPLTVGRIPFHVRYTTVFDDNGRAIKAYGSAALVVD